VTVEEDTPVAEIARLLAAYRIKRVPVVRDGRMVGIVSRADLLRALAAEQPGRGASGCSEPRHNLFSWIDHRFHHGRGPAPDQPTIQPSEAPGGDGLRVDDFRALVAESSLGARSEASRLPSRGAHSRLSRRAAGRYRPLSDLGRVMVSRPTAGFHRPRSITAAATG
jgi:hypothetical protein